MKTALRVVSPFGAFRIGDLISDVETICEIVGSETERYVVKAIEEVEELFHPSTDSGNAS